MKRIAVIFYIFALICKTSAIQCYQGQTSSGEPWMNVQELVTCPSNVEYCFSLASASPTGAFTSFGCDKSQDCKNEGCNNRVEIVDDPVGYRDLCCCKKYDLCTVKH